MWIPPKVSAMCFTVAAILLTSVVSSNAGIPEIPDQLLKQCRFPFHHWHSGNRPDVSQAKYRRTVSDKCHSAPSSPIVEASFPKVPGLFVLRHRSVLVIVKLFGLFIRFPSHMRLSRQTPLYTRLLSGCLKCGSRMGS